MGNWANLLEETVFDSQSAESGTAREREEKVSGRRERVGDYPIAQRGRGGAGEREGREEIIVDNLQNEESA